jgi:hypothetical protein
MWDYDIISSTAKDWRATVSILAEAYVSLDVNYALQMISYDLAVAEQFAERMGKEYKKLSDGRFINWERFDVYVHFDLVARQYNEFFEKLMRITFWEAVKA